MIIPLDFKFKKLMKKAWVFFVIVIPLYFLSSEVYVSDSRHIALSVLYIVLLVIFMFLKTARYEIEIPDNYRINHYWKVFGLKFHVTAITRKDIMGLYLIQLPTRYYAFSLKTKDKRDILLLEAATKKEIKDKIRHLWPRISTLPFLHDLNIKVMPGREYIERKAMIARKKAGNHHYDNGFGEDDGVAILIP